MVDDQYSCDVGKPPQPSMWLRAGSSISIITSLVLPVLYLYVVIKGTNADMIAFCEALVVGSLGLLFAFFQYKSVFQRCKDFAEIVGGILLLLGGVFLIVLTVIIYHVMRYDRAFDLSPQALVIAQVIFLLLAVVAIGQGVSSYRWARALGRYRKTESLCMNCGYNLRGIIASGRVVCPECGLKHKTINGKLTPLRPRARSGRSR